MHIKKLSSLLVVAGLSMGLAHAQTTKKPAVRKTQTSKPAANPVVFKLKDAKDSLSYALGMDIARSLKGNDFDIDVHTLTKGLDAVYKGGDKLLDENTIQQVIQQNIKAMMEKKNEAKIKPGKEYLAALKNNPNIHTTPEGVLYEILVQGEGSQPTRNSTVKVHYAGYLIDGNKFDSSYDRGEPLDLNLNQVIEGWKIGVPLMKVGSKYKFYIPYQLAYGERATGSIPEYSTLIFEIELLNIEEPDAV